jgi:hypothetical protein
MNYKWCHSPKCHTYKTQDRVRGSKGSKVLRTRKIKQQTESSWYNPNNIYNYFCSQGCQNDFWNTYSQRIVALAPMNEPLETPIEIETFTRTDYFGKPYTDKTIKERVDTAD